MKPTMRELLVRIAAPFVAGFIFALLLSLALRFTQHHSAKSPSPGKIVEVAK